VRVLTIEYYRQKIKFFFLKKDLSTISQPVRVKAHHFQIKATIRGKDRTTE